MRRDKTVLGAGAEGSDGTLKRCGRVQLYTEHVILASHLVFPLVLALSTSRRRGEVDESVKFNT